jgi:hypothetical protein
MFRGEVVLDTLTKCPAVVPTGPIRLEILTFVLICIFSCFLAKEEFI